MSNHLMQTFETFLAKEGASFSVPRDNSLGGSSDSESDGIEGHRTRKKSAKGFMPGLSSGNSDEELPSLSFPTTAIATSAPSTFPVKSPDQNKPTNPTVHPIKVIVVSDVVCSLLPTQLNHLTPSHRRRYWCDRSVHGVTSLSVQSNKQSKTSAYPVSTPPQISHHQDSTSSSGPSSLLITSVRTRSPSNDEPSSKPSSAQKNSTKLTGE